MNQDYEHITPLQFEQAVFRYTARYGQHPETEQKYREAINACRSIDYISLTLTDVARMYGLKPEPFRNQLKRHYPEILRTRTELRARLGIRESGNFGLKDQTVRQYAEAVELLRDPSVTVREAASRTGVSYQGLQQHLVFYHKDVADARMLVRSDALMKPLTVGGFNAVGGIRAPKPEAARLYEPAVEMYRTTDLPKTEIARRCGVPVHNFESYLSRWYKPLMEQRRERQRLQREEKQRAPKEVRSKVALARMKYEPAVALIASGKTLSEAARELGVPLYNLSPWLKAHYPALLDQAQAGQMRLPSGRQVLRKAYNKYLPIAEYIDAHPAEPTREVAARWGVPLSSLGKKMASYFPEIWKKHCLTLNTNAHE